jgi:hypothetical protein
MTRWRSAATTPHGRAYIRIRLTPSGRPLPEVRGPARTSAAKLVAHLVRRNQYSWWDLIRLETVLRSISTTKSSSVVQWWCSTMTSFLPTLFLMTARLCALKLWQTSQLRQRMPRALRKRNHPRRDRHVLRTVLWQWEDRCGPIWIGQPSTTVVYATFTNYMDHTNEIYERFSYWHLLI